MIELLFVLHKDITWTMLDEIIKIKTTAWPYSFEKQKEWLQLNLNESDIHVLLFKDKCLEAYMNLIDIEFIIDGNTKSGYGIGNVCSKTKGTGMGKKLVEKTNSYIIEMNRIGLLFCKSSLINFYKKNNWNTIEKKKLILSFNNESIETMMYNSNENFNNLIYLGKSF